MLPSDHGTFSHWHFITRLGEVQLLLPAALLVGLVLLHQNDSRPFAVRWLQALCLASGLTLISKIAFIGWGLGSAAFNFTGISGHAMFASAVYPFFAITLTCRLPTYWQRVSVMLSFVLVFLICMSRIMVGAHSMSEVLAGLLVGIAVNAYALAHVGLPRAELKYHLTLVMVIWLVVAPLQTPQVPTHSLVKRLTLVLSGHAKPHTREEMMRRGVAKSERGAKEQG
jgi:membrane-associated phospholipid phosphatase